MKELATIEKEFGSAGRKLAELILKAFRGPQDKQHLAQTLVEAIRENELKYNIGTKKITYIDRTNNSRIEAPLPYPPPKDLINPQTLIEHILSVANVIHQNIRKNNSAAAVPTITRMVNELDSALYIATKLEENQR